MDLTFSEKDLEFKAEIQYFIKENYPADIKEKQDNRLPLEKEEIVRWQKILANQGWFAINWPKEYGGTDWTPTQKYIFQNELAAAYRELRDELCMSEFRMTFAELEEASKANKEDDSLKKKLKAIKTVYPQKISEAEPKNLGG